MQKQVREDPGARRNRDEGGLWTINVLVSLLVAVLSLYVFRPDDTRRDMRVALATLTALPGQLAATPAMASPRD
jgi:hypothetical protein